MTPIPQVVDRSAAARRRGARPITVAPCRCAGTCRCGGLVPALLLLRIERECEFFRSVL